MEFSLIYLHLELIPVPLPQELCCWSSKVPANETLFLAPSSRRSWTFQQSLLNSLTSTLLLRVKKEKTKAGGEPGSGSASVSVSPVALFYGTCVDNKCWLWKVAINADYGRGNPEKRTDRREITWRRDNTELQNCCKKALEELCSWGYWTTTPGSPTHTSWVHVVVMDVTFDSDSNSKTSVLHTNTLTFTLV